MINPMELLDDKKKLTDAVISGSCYNVSKKIREIFVNHSALLNLPNEATRFFENNNIFVQRDLVGQDNAWTKNQLKRFYDVVGTNPHKDDLIATFNEAYVREREKTIGQLGPSEKEMLAGLNKIEEISHFLKAHKYSDPTFSKAVLSKAMICLHYGDVECLKDIAGALHMDMDKQTIEAVLSKVKYNYNHSDLERFNLLKTEESIRSKRALFDNISNGCGALLAMYTTVALVSYNVTFGWTQKLAAATLEEGQKIIEGPVGKHVVESITNSSVFDSITQGMHSIINAAPSFAHSINPHSLVLTAATMVALWPAKGYATRFFRKFSEVKNEDNVGALSVERCSEDNFKFFTRNRLVDGIVKKKEFDTTNEANAKHIALTGFLVEKLYEPAKKVSEFKAPDGTTLKDYLGLTAKEEQRLNQLSPDEIDTISQVKNLQAREVLSRNEVSPGELLAIKKLDQVQQVTGYSMKEKGQYLVNFSISDYPKLAINIAQSLATAEPVEKFIVSNALATFSQKEKGKITVDNRHNSIRDCLGTAEFNDKLVDMSQSWLIEKTKGKKFKEQLEEQEKKSSTANNQQTKQKLSEVFKEFSFESLDGILATYSREDGFGLVIKNKALNVMNAIRSKFASSDNPSARLNV
ncbi:hypothetical protein [Burkholderia cepacia]|uniref:hypothetical protein n=1 Tax=Burkholderia cepacia TaxID=292 RepID=UPI001CF414A5|nr:hypothetical protein [Burkholderia cepacia]MCA8351458.1 hypothetical protein [Burkholderia cepacia]